MADKFDIAVKIVQELPKEGPVQPSQDDRLLFYGLYKTATIGAVNTTKPSVMSFDPVGRAKWDAWKNQETTPAEECKKLYVEKLIAILEASKTPESEGYLKQLKDE